MPMFLKERFVVSRGGKEQFAQCWTEIVAMIAFETTTVAPAF